MSCHALSCRSFWVVLPFPWPFSGGAAVAFLLLLLCGASLPAPSFWWCFFASFLFHWGGAACLPSLPCGWCCLPPHPPPLCGGAFSSTCNYHHRRLTFTYNVNTKTKNWQIHTYKIKNAATPKQRSMRQHQKRRREECSTTQKKKEEKTAPRKRRGEQQDNLFSQLNFTHDMTRHL